MLALGASCISIFAAAALAVFAFRQARDARHQNRTAHEAAQRLKMLLAELARQTERLEAAIAAARELPTARPRPHSLDAIEALGDPAAMESGAALSAAASNLSEDVPGVPANLFADEERERKIIRLHEHGHPPVEIARRLGMSAGEVEFRLNLRRR